mgnify:FL=1|jgi:SAM-dependent methyltransferase
MKNIENWLPTKFDFRRGKLKASKHSKQVCASSRLITNLIGKFYQRELTNHAKGKLLDLGCGYVPLYSAYKDLIDDNYCVDWADSIHKNDFLDLIADLNEPLEIDSQSFDTIVLSDVLEHIRKPELLWNEMYRVLKKEGKLLMNVPFYYWLHEEPYDYFRYTKHALKAMAEEAGFKIISINPIGGVPEVLADIFSKNIKVIPLIGKPIVKFIQWSTWIFIHTGLGRKYSKKSANKFPYGYTVIAEKI